MDRRFIFSGLRNVKEMDPLPNFIKERQAIWDEIKADSDAQIASKATELITVN